MELTLRQDTLLVVDDQLDNVKSLAAILSSHYRILSADNGEDALSLVLNHIGQLDLVITNIQLPGISGYDLCARIRSYPETRNIPIIFVSSNSTPAEEALSLDIGAVDYIGKPYNPATVQARVRTQIDLKHHKDDLDDLVAERTAELVRAREDIISRLARASEARDNETGQHIVRLSQLCTMLGRAAGLSRSQARTLGTASLMHDIGKIGIPDAVLLKPAKHTPAERRIMETHTILGQTILANPDSDLLHLAGTIALTHHEYWNGKGYPNQLKGSDIPLAGRICAVCDVFDALTSERAYKRAWSVDKAADYIRDHSGEMFDPELVDLFLEHLEDAARILEQNPDPEQSPASVSSPT